MNEDTLPLDLPLSGIRVLDFGHMVMGPTAGLLLADLGADVIRIEPPDGDPTRKLPGFASGFFGAFNRNKRSVALDLKRPEGREVLLRLVRDADVLLENFGAGAMDRLGLGWDVLRAANPRLVFLSLKGYLAGPYEERGALDEVVQMQTGIAYMTGPPGRPLRAGASIVDILGAVFGVVAVQAALRERDRTGLGQRVGSSLFETGAFLVATHIAGNASTGTIMAPFPARTNAFGVYDVFGTREGGPVFLAVTSDLAWPRFKAAFDLGPMAEDPRLATNADRSRAREWFIPALREIIGALDRDEVCRRAEAARIPFAPVQRPSDILEDPHLLASGGLLETGLSPTGEGGPYVGIPALPMEFGDERRRLGLRRQPARIGEHAREVLAEAGFTAAEIASLLRAGTVRDHAAADTHDTEREGALAASA